MAPLRSDCSRNGAVFTQPALRPARREAIVAPAVAFLFSCMISSAEGFASGFAPLAAVQRAQGLTQAPFARTSLNSLNTGNGRARPMSLRMQEGEGEKLTGWELWTRPRTTNANWGIFFEVATKDRAGGHSFAGHEEYTRLDISVFTSEGPAAGKELDKSKWTLLGEEKNFILPRVEVGDSQAQYHTVPFKTIHVPANSVRAFCIHTNQQRGLALRRKLNFDTRFSSDPNFKEWNDGVTDEGMHFNIKAGVVPGAKLFEELSKDNSLRAFVGVIEYDLKDPQ